MVNAVGTSKQFWRDVPVGPACHILCVGMAEVVEVLGAVVEGLGQFVGVPGMGIGLVDAHEVVVLGIAIGGVAVEIDSADETLEVAAGKVIIIELLASEDRFAELAKDG